MELKRRIVIYVLLLGAGIMITSCGQKEVQQAEIKINHEDLSLTGAQIESVTSVLKMFPDNTEASIAIIKGSEVLFCGFRREDGILIDTQNQGSAFEIGSISKVFTSTLLAGFITEGRVSGNDYINDYLDFLPADSALITFVQLANHTSGLPRIPSNMLIASLLHRSNPYSRYDTMKLKKYISTKLELNSTPGEKYAYSNLGPGLLSYTLCRIDNSTYEELLNEMIFTRFGMTNSTTIRENLTTPLVKGRNRNGRVTSNWDLGALEGAGAILSTAEDMSIFALAQFDTTNRDLLLTREKTFSETPDRGIGLGWHITSAEDGREIFWHNGGTGGYRSCMAIDPGTENGVIIMTNVSAGNNSAGQIDELCFNLLASLNQN
jgi:CubicO group peptidase (beta-lactamase class C family)